jgi:hypothetical protein
MKSEDYRDISSLNDTYLTFIISDCASSEKPSGPLSYGIVDLVVKK